MSNRSIDSRGEAAISVFLDKYFYPELTKVGDINSFRRIYEKNAQKKGIDIILDDTIALDEKSQIYYINKPLNTFIFEISFFYKESKGYIDGWFVSENNETQVYLFLWINEARTNEVNRLVAEDFTSVEAMFIEKKRVKEYISSLGFSDAKLAEYANKMRENSTTRMDINEDCHLTLSNKLEEKPINLVVNKEILEKLCKSSYIVGKDGLKKLK